MNYITTLFILITAFLHILFFKLESIDFMKPTVLKKFGLNEESALNVKVWAFNQGFYNLFLSIGLLYSIYLLFTGNLKEGNILASFILLLITGAGATLYFSSPSKIIPATAQCLPALIGFILLRFTFKV